MCDQPQIGKQNAHEPKCSKLQQISLHRDHTQHQHVDLTAASRVHTNKRQLTNRTNACTGVRVGCILPVILRAFEAR